MLWYNKPILNSYQIKQLQKHQYASDNNSILDPYFQPWWNYVVTLVPMWVAPNLITITGLAINMIAALLLIYHCPSAREEVSGWIPLALAITMFLYQTLDAIDGKQARRTGSSNALGELFDHGCDSLSNLVLSTAGACAMSMGYIDSFLMMGYCYLALVLFYLSHWQTYVTGRMRFGQIDATEAQVTMMMIMVITAIAGTGFWGIKVLGFLPLRYCPLVFGTICALWSFPPILNKILFEGKGKNGSTVAGTSVITPIIPLLFVLVPAVYLASNSSENILETNSLRFIMTFGLIGSKITNKLIVAQMTKSELPYLDCVFLGPVLMYVNQSKGPFISERILLNVILVFAIVDYALYCQKVCQDICEQTGWKVFKIKPVRHLISKIEKASIKSKIKSEKVHIKIEKTVSIETMTRSSTNKKLYPLSQNNQASNGQGKH